MDRVMDRFQRFVRIPGFASHMWQAHFLAMVSEGVETASGAALKLWCLLGDEGRIDLTVWGHYAVSKGIIGKPAWSTILTQSWLRGKTGSLLSPRTGFSYRELVAMFEAADQEHLMDDDERAALAALPDRIEVYRGTSGISVAKARGGMSWTTDKATAAWFANLFGGIPLVLRAEARKADVLAYFSHEVVVRPQRVSKVSAVQVRRDSVRYDDRELLVA